MNECPKCARENPDSSRACLGCGQTLASNRSIIRISILAVLLISTGAFAAYFQSGDPQKQSLAEKTEEPVQIVYRYADLMRQARYSEAADLLHPSYISRIRTELTRTLNSSPTSSVSNTDRKVFSIMSVGDLEGISDKELFIRGARNSEEKLRTFYRSTKCIKEKYKVIKNSDFEYIVDAYFEASLNNDVRIIKTRNILRKLDGKWLLYDAGE